MADLPIYALREDLRESVYNRIVIEAPTGSGKSTQIPQMLLDDGLAGRGEVVVLQPRRIAARLLARRVAGERYSRVGDEVGYQVQLERCISSNTKIRYVTEGLLLRQMLSEPDLPFVGALVFDEFHERHVYSDVTLGRALLLQQSLRPDLKIVVMSATLDSDRIASWLGPCEILRSEGRTYPVEISYGERRVDPAKKPIWEQAAEAVRQASKRPSGDILVFMPGAHEIRRTAELLRLGPGWQVLPLYGEMPLEQQEKSLRPGDQRKVVIATNVAETSLTIPGVEMVIDSGLARIPRYDSRRGIDTLHIEKISRASADQRAGRAGRVAPGHCMRLWTEHEQHGMALQETPEILRRDLSEILLSLMAGGVAPADFPWLDAPEPEALKEAMTLLSDMGAVHDDEITPLGRTLLSFPAPPRMARMLVEAAREHCLEDAATLAALLMGRPILERRIATHIQKNRDRALGDDVRSDVDRLLLAFDEARHLRFNSSRCRELGIHGAAASRANDVRQQLLKTASRLPSVRPSSSVLRATADKPTQLSRCILTAYADRVAKRLDVGTLRCELARGLRADLSGNSCCKKADLLVALELIEIGHGRGKSAVNIALASPVEREWLDELFPEAMHERDEHYFDPGMKRVLRRKAECLHQLVLSELVDREVDPSAAAEVLAAMLRKDQLQLPKWNDAVEQWIARVNCLAQWCPEWGIPPIDDEARTMIIEDLCLGCVSARDLRMRDVMPAVHGWLNASQKDMVKKYAPDRIKLPGGWNMRITYKDGAAPEGSAMIQDLYGLKETPRVANGRAKIRLSILAPNRRPVQITEDLPSFWKEHYPALKKELSRRYYKHEWRDDV